MVGDKKNPGWVKEIGSMAFVVYCLIAKQYNHSKNAGPYMSHRTMASILGISKTTLEDKLKQLVKAGLIDQVRHGKRNMKTWSYRPRIPVPGSRENGSNIDPKTSSNGPENGPKKATNGPDSDPKLGEIGPIPEKIGPMFSLKSFSESNVKKENEANFKRQTRLYTRLIKRDMSPENQVTVALRNLEQIGQKTQVQVAWNYWGHLWEQHYGRPYYLANSKGNAKTIPRDKKNLRDKIEAVGFKELIVRMKRCIEVCDELYPCRQKGKWLRAITLNDFVSSQFFDQWIPPKSESREREPRSLAERVRATRERHQNRVESEPSKFRSGEKQCGKD